MDVDEEMIDKIVEVNDMGFIPAPEPTLEKAKFRKIEEQITGLPRTDDTSKRVQAEKSSPIQDFLGVKDKEEDCDKPATVNTPDEQTIKKAKSPVAPEHLPTYRQKTNRMFTFKPKSATSLGNSSINSFFNKFSFNK